MINHLLAPPPKPTALALPTWLQLFPPSNIEWNRIDLPLPNLPSAMKGLRILHLSDVHLRRRWPAALDLVLEKIAADPPDLLLFTGDFVDSKRNHRPAMPQVRRFVDGFRARLGCFAIHGNHDSYAIGKSLGNSPVEFLDGVRRIVACPRGQIELIGLPGKHRTELSRAFVANLPPRNPGQLRIILSHFPDHLKRTRRLDADIFLSGHTHGGQMCLPGGQALLTHDSLPRRLAAGAHRVGKTWLLVSRGIGWTGLPVRTHCPPEVVEIRIA